MIFRFLLIAFLLFNPVDVYAGGQGTNSRDVLVFSQEDGDAVLQWMEEDERFYGQFSICVADNFRKYQSIKNRLGFDADLSVEECVKDPQACFEACQSGHGQACFRLARGLEGMKPRLVPEAAQMAFAFSCAAGYSGGCTNRGAGMRNGQYGDDPAQKWSQSDLDDCQFRLFKAACGDDAWGCAMLGQAYLYGEGTKASEVKAIRSFMKVCKIAEPDHASCRFAQEYLDELSE